MPMILIVDDSKDDQDILKEFISSQPKARFLLASSGQEALETLKNEKIDLIISDYHMKNGDGLWLLQKLKKLKDPPRCILITGEQRFSENYFVDLGAASVCFKPLDFSRLHSEILRLL